MKYFPAPGQKQTSYPYVNEFGTKLLKLLTLEGNNEKIVRSIYQPE